MSWAAEEFQDIDLGNKEPGVQPMPAAKATSEGEEDDDPTEEYLVTVREIRQ